MLHRMGCWKCAAFLVCAALVSTLNVAAGQVKLDFTVQYPEWQSCTKKPADPLGNVPCGPDIQFYVVLAPCPALEHSECWDPLSSTAVSDVPLCNKAMPIGGCLPAMPTETKGILRTTPVSVPSLKGRYALASVYWTNTILPMKMGIWQMQFDLAQRIPLEHGGSFELSPHFLNAGRGRLSTVFNFDMPQFGRGTVQNVSVYEPPGCVENPAACAKAKVVVVTDGQVLQHDPMANLLIERADGLLAERRASTFLLLLVPSTFKRANETSDWSCARGAMLTPGPCDNGDTRCGPRACDGTFGQSDALFQYIGETLLPWVAMRFHGAGRGQRAGIVGFSYGGLTSCYAAWARQDLFDAAGCGSPSLWYPTPQCVDKTAVPYLNGTYIAEVAMKKFPTPVTTRLYVSYGTAEALCMGGTYKAPGPIPLTVQAMRDAGMQKFPLEENAGYEHDAWNGWLDSTIWRALGTILPYEPHPEAHLTKAVEGLHKLDNILV